MSEADADELVRRFIVRKYRTDRCLFRGPARHLRDCPDLNVVDHDMDEGFISEVTLDPCTDISATMGCPHLTETDDFHWSDFASIPEVIAQLIAMEEAERNPPPPPSPPTPEPPLFEYVRVPLDRPIALGPGDSVSVTWTVQ